MIWCLVALVVWVLSGVGTALFIGAASQTGEGCDRTDRVPDFVPAAWSLTTTP